MMLMMTTTKLYSPSSWQVVRVEGTIMANSFPDALAQQIVGVLHQNQSRAFTADELVQMLTGELAYVQAILVALAGTGTIECHRTIHAPVMYAAPSSAP
jgi:hypothetical protein